MKLVTTLILIAVIVLTMLYYYRKAFVYRHSADGQQILANASQLTMSAFLLGLALILFQLNTFGISRGNYINSLLIYGAFVSTANAAGVWYYGRHLPKSK
ncbi:hypothetical protein [Vagococcus acidifermentans]|uniref:Uncharacterized protein n=1 Tax=Vagococcus acidifermentans TaxID=564710 RepID=A0A430ALN1_9ENTE|nr:hypothetical protein [Vagococcus acidifermentans]RSU09031.1 hypothetical protein CBF27_13525 [Vagococcus acidifermentans]